MENYIGRRTLPPLQYEEEAELANKIKGGCRESRDKLITANMGLASKLANDYSAEGVEYDDLQAAALVGLIKAVDTFDPSRGKFSVHAAFYIRNQLHTELSAFAHGVPYRNDFYRRQNRVNKMREKMALQNETLTVEDVMEEIGCGRNLALRLMEGCVAKLSLEHKDENGKSVGEKLAASESDGLNSPDTDYMLADNARVIAELLTKLPTRDRKVVQNFFGIGSESCTLDDLAAELNLTRSRVGQLKDHAVDSLRKMLFRKDRYAMQKLLATA